MKASVLSLTLLMVTGCSTRSSTLPASQSTEATTPQTSKLNPSLLAQASPSSQASPRSQRFASDRQNQLDDLGYRDGYEDGAGGFPASVNVGIANQNLTDPTEQKIYTDAYNRGYAAGKGISPPTNTVSPARRAELQQKGKQDGANDAQPGSNLAANPGSGIAALGLTDPTEIQIYTDAYNAAYQQASRPKPITGRLDQLKQQGYNEGYADAQANLSQDPNRSTTFLSLVDKTEQDAYRNSYSAGYQRYGTDVQPPPISPLW